MLDNIHSTRDIIHVCVRVCVCTVGGQSVRLTSLGVGGVDSRLLHAAELRLASVGRHGRGSRR